MLHLVMDGLFCRPSAKVGGSAVMHPVCNIFPFLNSSAWQFVSFRCGLTTSVINEY